MTTSPHATSESATGTTTGTATGPATGTGTAPARTYRSSSRSGPARLLLRRETAVIALLALVYYYAFATVPFFAGDITLYYLFLDLAPILVIALPMTLNLPFGLVAGAGCRHFSDGSGDLALAVKPGNRIAYLHLWPHARPWHVTRPEPMMRSVPEAAEVAAVLARALSAAREVDEEAASPVIRPRARGPRLATAS